jgi:hypothetical protein
MPTLVLNLLVRYFSKRNNIILVDIIVTRIETHFEASEGYKKNKLLIDKYETGIVIYGRSFHRPGISSVSLIRIMIK